MTLFIRSLGAEGLKMKRQPVLLLHLIAPLSGISLFLLYYTYSPWPLAAKVGGYLEALAVTYPFLIGLACSMAAEQENLAGNYQLLLVSPQKVTPFYAKLFCVLALGLGAVLLAAAGFGFGMRFLFPSMPLQLDFYLAAGGILFASNLFLYAVNWVVGLRFGKGAAIGLGVVESLLACLLLTGLGNGRWYWNPCGWGVRFMDAWLGLAVDRSQMGPLFSELGAAIAFCVAETAVILLLSGVWFYFWEGKKSEE